MGLDVVVVDQDRQLAELYCEFLTSHGFRAEASASRSGCSALLRDRPPRVLVLDGDLGRGVAELILSDLRARLPSVPVVLTTWGAAPMAAAGPAASPVVLCLRKFFPLPSLLDGIRFALGTGNGHRQRAECMGPTRRPQMRRGCATYSS